MKEAFSIIHIDDEVTFRFYTAYHYNNIQNLVNINLHLKDFDLAVGNKSKRILLIPGYDYKITFEDANRDSTNHDNFNYFINNDCLKIFKLKPCDLFKFLISRNIYRFKAIIDIFNQIRLQREDDTSFEYLDSINYKNSSVCGISWSTITSIVAKNVYTNCKERDLFDRDLIDIERKTIEIDVENELKIPLEISLYCKRNPYQLELDFGEN